MASNKKAQILAAVMCASSIFGSYTVVSAADTPTKIESTDKNSSVTANGSTITATAGAQGSQQSTITLGNKSLAINVGKQTTTDGITYGAFSLNSSNVVVNGNRLTMKSSTSSYAADLTNAGLTIKDGKTTVASLTNAGLSVNNATGTRIAGISSTGAITGTGLTVKAASDTIKPEGNYVESKVTTSGVADTIKQGGFTRATSNVTTNSIKDTIYTDSGIELSSINVFKNTAANGIENGKVSLTAKKIVTDNQTSTTTTSTLTLGGDNASLKVGNYGFTVDSNNNVLFSGKNASLTSTGLTVNGTGTSSIKSTNTNENSSTVGSYTKNDISYNGMTTTAKGGKYPSDSDNDNKTTSSVTYTGVRDTVYDDSGNIKSTSVVDTNGVTLTSNRYDTGSKISSSLTIKGDSATLTSGTAYVKVDNTVGNVTLSGKNASLTSTGLTVNGTGTSSIKSTNATTEAYTKNDISYAGMTTTVRGGKNPSESDNVNKTTSAVTYTGVTDTVYDDGGNLKTKSSVTTSGITNTVYDVNTGNALANSSLTTSGISNTTTDLAMTGTNEGKKMSTALYQNSNGISASATKKDENGTVGTSTLTLAGDSASLKVGNYGFTVDSNNNVLFSGKNASLTSTGLTVNGTGTSSIKSTNATTEAYTKNDISYAGMTTTVRGGKNPSESDNVNKTTSAVTYTGVTDTVYDDGGNLKTKSSVTTSGITNTVYDVNTGNALANSSLTTSGISNTTTDLAMTGTNEGKKMSTALYQNSNGISASATKKDENGTVGTSTLTLAGNSASLKVGNYGFAVDSNNNVSIAGNNATLSGSTFTLKDANGKTATLNTSGLTLKDEDGNTTGGISSTGAITGTSLRITTSEDTNGNKTVSTVATNGVTDTVTNNKTNNKTTSQVSANGVTDTVYGTDGTTKVASSSVSTSGISNTTSLKTTTGKIDTAINQNTSGVGISSTKYDTNNNVTDKTSVSVNGGTSSITSYGNYIYGEDGKATSYNQASISLNGNTGTATIRGGSNTASSTLTLNEAGVALSGKNVGLNANGLTLYKDVDGVKTQYASLSTGGLSVNGTGYTTIKSTNATTGAIGQSQVSYNGVTDSFTKDDVTNSVTTNANGTTFSSTGNGSTTIKGDTIKTTNLIVNGKDIGGVATDVAGIDRNTENEDGLGYYTQIEGKTKIYNTGRFSTANGNFVVDPYGSITSKAGNYRFNMDRTNGFDLGYAATTSFTLDNTGVSLGFRNNSFILDKNGATFINANGENVSFTSINGGTITTGETVINGSSITTKDLYVDNIHLNGAITDGNGNVVGGGDLSLGADGTLDLKYNANGITNTFVSGATGVHSSFSNGTTTASSSVGYIDDKNTIGIKDQVGNTSVTTTTDGTTFANGSGSTTINGGNITTTGDVTVGGDLSVGDNFKVDGTTGNVTGGTYNGVQISTDKDGNAIIGGTNIGDLATNEEVNKVNDKVDAVDNKVGDTSKLDKEITDNQNYKDNQNLVGAVNAEADIRRNEISRIDGQIEQLDGRVGSLENRMSDVEDRIDKVGAMSAAIANLRTMGFDPEAPTEIAIGVGQYKSETGLALGVFHYPNQDFMLSASISTSGDEVMGGIGATWKLGRKSAAEKAKDEEARRLEKAEEMKKLAQDAKVKAQAERHAKLLAEREAQKTA